MQNYDRMPPPRPHPSPGRRLSRLSRPAPLAGSPQLTRSIHRPLYKLHFSLSAPWQSKGPFIFPLPLLSRAQAAVPSHLAIKKKVSPRKGALNRLYTLSFFFWRPRGAFTFWFPRRSPPFLPERQTEPGNLAVTQNSIYSPARGGSRSGLRSTK